jgi:hypothetical protein
VVGGALALGGVAGVALAASYDNLVPTANYSPICTTGSSAGEGTLCQTDNATLTVFMQSSINSTANTAVHVISSM